MTLALLVDKQALKRRCQQALARRVPPQVAGSLMGSRQFKDDAAVIAAFVARGVAQDKARAALARVESQQGCA